ncbi:MAG: Pyruvate kinase [Chloroflexi bacterium ADurb.Bin360]|nr:MAG: Pyruvate kinase [Chloroflexi bacterium ADurb.Bin360]
MPLTKIVCTLGPATESPEVIRAMIRAGMTVARLNFSHGGAEGKHQMAELIRRVAHEENRFVALMGDLQGPKIRVGKLPEGGVPLEEGREIILTSGPIADPQHEIPFPHPDIILDLRIGDHILLDDGTLELEVLAVMPPAARCRVKVGGMLSSNKGVNLPGVALKLTAMTEKDCEDAAVALELELDYLALSFVRSAKDVDELRAHLKALVRAGNERLPGENPHRIPAIVAKIEKPEALQDLETIVRAADAVMVARGDLGVETAPERVPLAQKEIIRLCNRLGKPVITATQMLQSMIDNPRPTRAEASDVANAIIDGSDAVMLSGETSVGKYPVEAVRMMARISESVEASTSFPYNQLLNLTGGGETLPTPRLISRSISRATVEIAEECGAKAILTSTESGRTARTVARHRPRCPLIAATPFEQTARRLQLVWGVIPALVEPFHDTDSMIQTMIQAAVRLGYAKVDDEVVLTAGIPFEVHGVTNMLKVHTVRKEDLKS